MARFPLVGALALALAGCGELEEQAHAQAQIGGPPPGVLPAGVYTGPPLARLPDGPVLWSSGERATGQGETQVQGAQADYRRLARAQGGLLACGLTDTKRGYFSGLTGRHSCVVHGPGGQRREILPRSRSGRRGFHDVVVRGGVLVASSGDAVEVRDLRTGRKLGEARTAGAQRALHLPGLIINTGPAVRSGAAALIPTEAGLAHVRILDHGRGWRVWSQSVTWTDRGIRLGPPASAPLPPELARIAHTLTLTGGGLDGRRFLLGSDHPRLIVIAELAGAPAEALVRWSGEAPALSDLDVQGVAENGVVGLGAHGSADRAALLVNLRGQAPALKPLALKQPACAVTRRPGQPPPTTVRFISGPAGLEAVAEWPGRLARCWSTTPVTP